MIEKVNSVQNFNGKLVVVDKCGKNANLETQRIIFSQLGSAVLELKSLIAPKPFDLFVSKGSTDYISVNANKTYIGVLRGDINFYSLHKSTLDKIVNVARKSVQEYENFLQKNV